jgi:prepilin-type N-terminal cleavage/methylation domain-containing protein
MKENTKKGFTLIELLVVISIIGILSSVVLASLNVARGKGADAAIKTDLSGIRSQAEIFFDTNGHYGDDSADCTTANSLFVDPNITAAITHAGTVSGTGATCLSDDGVAAGGTAATTWAVSVPLKTNPAVHWCTDYTGIATTSATGAQIVSDIAACQ